MVDFLSNHDGNCRTVSAQSFKVCDDQQHPMSYLDLSGSARGADVKNDASRELIFRPVDRALYGSTGGRRCDLMLRTAGNDRLCFVELKDWKVSGWLADGVEQLENTLQDFEASHPGVLMAAPCRSAYVVNIARHGFSRVHSATMRDFVRKYHVILRTTQPIVIR